MSRNIAFRIIQAMRNTPDSKIPSNWLSVTSGQIFHDQRDTPKKYMYMYDSQSAISSNEALNLKSTNLRKSKHNPLQELKTATPADYRAFYYAISSFTTVPIQYPLPYNCTCAKCFKSVIKIQQFEMF